MTTETANEKTANSGFFIFVRDPIRLDQFAIIIFIHQFIDLHHSTSTTHRKPMRPC
jgi:hypothetical protein